MSRWGILYAESVNCLFIVFYCCVHIRTSREVFLQPFLIWILIYTTIFNTVSFAALQIDCGC